MKDRSQQFPLVTGADDPILRTVCSPVTTFNPAIHELYQALGELVRTYEGVGLAAPQIGQTVRMCAVTQWDTSKKKRELLEEIVMINPEIIGHTAQMSIEEEACLSLPGKSGDVSRRASITVKYMTIDSKEHILKATGYNARIIQHEIDHLDGVLFIDKLV